MEHDLEIGHAAWRIYRRLRRELDFREPQPVKIGILADRLRIGNTQAIDGVNYLVRAGYLVEHARTNHRVRTFTLAWSRKVKKAS